MWQFVSQAQLLPQARTHREQFQHATIGGFRVGAKNEARHQLPLSEIMTAASGTIIGQVPRSQFHGQVGYLFNRRRLLLAIGIHTSFDGSAPRPFKTVSTKQKVVLA